MGVPPHKKDPAGAGTTTPPFGPRSVHFKLNLCSSLGVIFGSASPVWTQLGGGLTAENEAVTHPGVGKLIGISRDLDSRR